MAVNTNVAAITFANGKIRPMADLLYTTYQTAKSVLAQWNAQGVSSVLPNDASYLDDGSAPVASGTTKTPDGRPPMTDAQATSIITRCQDLVNWMEGSAGIAAGDGSKAVLNTVAAVEVNGKATL